MHTSVEKKNMHMLDSNMQDIERKYHLTFTEPAVRRTKRSPLSFVTCFEIQKKT